ncbi:MAG: tRNA lysidine(34) synthetase TilS, partial [Rubrivivax sp.]
LGLSAARRTNLLRGWLALQHHAGIPETLVQRLMIELPRAHSARWPLGAGQLQCHAGMLRHAVDIAPSVSSTERPLWVDLSRAGRHEVPGWGGAFEVWPVDAQGTSPQHLRHCELRPRRGGERFQRGPRTVPRALKKQFQAAKVPAWQRDGPLVYAAAELLYVPGLGIDARRHAEAGQAMLCLRWLPGAAD